MFWSKTKTETNYEARCKELEGKIDTLTDDRLKLKEEVEDLKIEKKTSEEDIKHMVKKKEEMNEIQYQKKVMENDRERETAVAAVKDTYRDKLETNLISQKDDIKEMYAQILKRLPDVNARLNISQKD